VTAPSGTGAASGRLDATSGPDAAEDAVPAPDGFDGGGSDSGGSDGDDDGLGDAGEVRFPLLKPPYPAEIAALLTSLGQPPDGPRPPLALVRAYATHPEVAGALAPAMSGMLKLIARDPATREMLVLRVCARAACWSEWGIHAAVTLGRLGLPARRIALTLASVPNFTGTDDEALRAVVELADVLHDHAAVPTALWDRLTALWSNDEVLELITIAGFYRLVAQTANALRVPPEAWAAGPADPEFQEAR
jgi:alkylhydroperoxidase family enzyme